MFRDIFLSITLLVVSSSARAGTLEVSSLHTPEASTKNQAISAYVKLCEQARQRVIQMGLSSHVESYNCTKPVVKQRELRLERGRSSKAYSARGAFQTLFKEFFYIQSKTLVTAFYPTEEETILVWQGQCAQALNTLSQVNRAYAVTQTCSEPEITKVGSTYYAQGTLLRFYRLKPNATAGTYE